MRKIFVLFLLFFAIQSSCFAQSGMSFLYINGSNNNDAKMKKWYENGVKKLHPEMKKAFEKNEFTQQYFLKNGDIKIEEKPVTFFWGDKSQEDLSFVERNLAISKGFSPWIAYQVRSMITHFLHDAIWVQKYHNMFPVLEDLHKYVKIEAAKGNQIVLFGYSAGSFITYEYFLTRVPYIDVQNFFNSVEINQEQKDFISKHPAKKTCMSALGQELAVFSAGGHIIPVTDNNKFEKGYMNLDKMTDDVCAPEKSVKGIVNFASPLVLFYSDLSDPNFQVTYYNRLLFEHIIENDMFWITVNYREDPLGFPGGKNLSIEEIENIANLDIDPHAGFMYDQSDTWGRNGVFTAHTSYWSTRKHFAKSVVKAYVNGYNHQYDDSTKLKPVKHIHKKLLIKP